MKTLSATIRFGYTPDTDDAFHYYAIEHGLVGIDDEVTILEFERHCVQKLNEKAMDGELEVSAISSVLYPRIADKYVILSAGSSVGRNYGPLLGARKDATFTSLEGKTVAIPGRETTGYFLLQHFYRGFKTVTLPVDQVADAVNAGKADAGVLIHEELLNYEIKNIKKMACLGNLWFEATGFPLPVGLTVARRDLGMERIRAINSALRRSMRYALNSGKEAMSFANRFSTKLGVTDEFVSKFANTDTECMPDDVRRGLREVFRLANRDGFNSTFLEPEIIE